MMRISIASRIFCPEPSAASIRLDALAKELSREGFDVEVLTVKPLRGTNHGEHSSKKYIIRRFPVLRDKTGYVRGYIPYISFDIPLFFRILFGRRKRFLIVEPPPTTGVVVRCAAALRRIPYAYYAADIWSDAAKQTTAPKILVHAVSVMETWAWKGARIILSVSTGVTERLSQLGVSEQVVTIGNGIDTRRFEHLVPVESPMQPHFVYAGTASEWHGAEIFVEAFYKLHQIFPEARLTFIGGGSEKEVLERRVIELKLTGSVTFEEVKSITELIPILQSATLSLASVKPGSGYDFAFPTKLYTAVASGSPVLYTGIGPAKDFVEQSIGDITLGFACDYEVEAVSTAMLNAVYSPISLARKKQLSEWAIQNVSINIPAQLAVEAVQSVIRNS